MTITEIPLLTHLIKDHANSLEHQIDMLLRIGTKTNADIALMHITAIQEFAEKLAEILRGAEQ
jgi:hypothetical protein